MNRLCSLLAAIRRNQRRQPCLPRFLTYLVTFACNARCTMCDSWQKMSSNDLSLDEIRAIFAQLPPMDMVRLSGGEPFLRSDLAEIARAAQELLRPFMLHITTNGLLTKRIIEFCETRDKHMPLYLLISLDGMAEKHNQVRGVPGAWDAAVRTLRALAPKQRMLNLHLAVNQTIVDTEGCQQYAQLREFLRPLGVQHNVVMAYDASATYSREEAVNIAPTEIGKFTTFGKFSHFQLDSLLREVEKDCRGYAFSHRIAKRYYLTGLRQRLLYQHAYPNPPCVALSSHIRLLPDGTIPTCQFNTIPIGNVRQQRFAEIWSAPPARKQRQWVQRCPGCWAECEVLPNAFYTGDLLRLAIMNIKHHRQ